VPARYGTANAPAPQVVVSIFLAAGGVIFMRSFLAVRLPHLFCIIKLGARE